MRIAARNRLTMLNGALAARREPGSPGHYSWVWVIPLPGGGYRVRTFEVASELVDDDVSFFDEDMRIVGDERVTSLDDIDEAVARVGVDPEALDAPWTCDFPL
ncbi:hypothetical protein [Streptomyces triticirhizae]|nr:hypothetical protein [Streptomyces triticirhizae]